MSNIAQQAGEMLQENDELEEDEATPSRFERLDSKKRRIHDGSQMRIRIFKHITQMYLKTGVHAAIVTVNESKNITYFSTLKDGGFFKFIQLVTALEAAKKSSPAKTQMTSDLTSVINAFEGTTSSKGQNYVVKVGQSLAELGLGDYILNDLQQAYCNKLASEPDFDVAAATKSVLKEALVQFVLRTIRRS